MSDTPSPIDPNAKAAHELLSELLTTMATQELPYQHGVETRALGSLFELFGKTRAVIKGNSGAHKFAAVATALLNEKLRPLTAKWHPLNEQGVLASRDGGDEFRGDLRELQKDLVADISSLHQMAYGTSWQPQPAAPVIPLAEFAEILKSMPFGIPVQSLIKAPAKKDTPPGQRSPGLKTRGSYHQADDTDTVDEINKSERADVSARREQHQISSTAGEDAVGLAFSGGGIRSATFCLGVAQVLADKDLLKEVDFLSTVSGGGYTGSFLTQEIGGRTPVAASPPAATTPHLPWSQVAKPDGPDTGPIRRLRQRAKYVTAHSLWDAWGMVTATIAGMLINWVPPLLVLTVLAVLTVVTRLVAGWMGVWGTLVGLLPWVVAVCIAAAVAFSLRYFLLLRKASTKASGAGRHMAFAVLLWIVALMGLGLHSTFVWAFSGHCLPEKPIVAKVTKPACCPDAADKSSATVTVTVNAEVAPVPPDTAAAPAPADTAAPATSGAAAAAPVPDEKPKPEAQGVWKSRQAVLQALSCFSLSHHFGLISFGALASIVPALLRFLPLLKTPKIRMIVTKVALVIAAVFVPLMGFVVFILLCLVGVIDKVILHIPASNGLVLLIILAVCLSLIAIYVLNINVTGPHRLYRDGLSKTFVEPSEDGNILYPLHTINSSRAAPYHLVNAALNLPTSQSPVLRERKCDFFLFSKYWTGSPVTGYQPTHTWRMNDRPADLGTAMAISGAAFSSNMGLGSIAPLRGLLTLLNVRLGFWIRQPHLPDGMFGSKHPGFLCLLREMTGLGMEERHRWLNLSDGGHIENLAIYELLRRRCKFIVAVDGEADPDFTFVGLMTLVRHAQIDFGVRIESDLSDIRPGATGVSRSHYQLCKVHYPPVYSSDNIEVHPGGTGLLLYIKLSVTGNEGELIKRYRITHPEFPHQTTLDQFFDEEQFEAYRELGAHVARGLFSHCLMNGDPAPKTIRDWFTRLAKNLLVS